MQEAIKNGKKEKEKNVWETVRDTSLTSLRQQNRSRKSHQPLSLYEKNELLFLQTSVHLSSCLQPNTFLAV